MKKFIVTVLLLVFVGCIPWPCVDQICKSKSLEVPSTFDNITTATTKIYTGTAIQSIIQADLQSRGITYTSNWYWVDGKYLGYREDIIRLARRMMPTMYNHVELIGRTVPEMKGSYESSDCDNVAEWMSTWFHSMLPSSAAVQISGCNKEGKCHRYCGVATNDGRVIWFNGTPEDWSIGTREIHFKRN